jgi:hypothetical protein
VIRGGGIDSGLLRGNGAVEVVQVRGLVFGVVHDNSATLRPVDERAQILASEVESGPAE